MTLISKSDERHMAAQRSATRAGYRSVEELAMRDRLETWARERWPDCRVVHELVMDRGKVRADMAAVAPDHLAVFEIKGLWDDTTRLVHQIGMFRLAAPELWLVHAEKHDADAALMRYLLPSLGLLRMTGVSTTRYDSAPIDPDAIAVEVVAEAVTDFVPHPRVLLPLCWVAELAVEARVARVWQGAASRPPTHAKLVDLMARLEPGEQLRAVCRQLRARDAFWRADPPVRDGEAVAVGGDDA